MTRHALVVRPDSLGDVLVCGPAIRAVAAVCDRVTVLAGPRGAEAAALLPGVDDVVVAELPWIAADPPLARNDWALDLVARLRALAIDEALVLTSFHQNALPTALLLRMAGVRQIGAVSTDYPGSLLDVRVAEPPDAPEPLRMTTIAGAAGYPVPPGDDGSLRVRAELPLPSGFPVLGPHVLLHPGAAAPTRSVPEALAASTARALLADGWEVVLTGTAGERRRNARIAADVDDGLLDLTGTLDLRGLAAVMREAAAVVSGNTGPAHLAAALGTPVVTVFAPVVPAERWAPLGPAVALLGDQQAACRGTRARICPVPGHPCVDGLSGEDVVAALRSLLPEAVPA